MLNNDADFHMKLAVFRRKAADGTISLEEMREAVELMRKGRASAAQASAKAKATKAKAAPASADAMLDELAGL